MYAFNFHKSFMLSYESHVKCSFHVVFSWCKQAKKLHETPSNNRYNFYQYVISSPRSGPTAMWLNFYSSSFLQWWWSVVPWGNLGKVTFEKNSLVTFSTTGKNTFYLIRMTINDIHTYMHIFSRCRLCVAVTLYNKPC